MNEIRLRDSSFAHTHSISNGNLKVIPKNFIWNRTDTKQKITFFTGNHIHEIDTINNKSDINIATIFEPIYINRSGYDFLFNNSQKFTYILTYNRDILKRGMNFKFIPSSGCWIEEKDQLLYEKSKNLSVIFSNKKHTDGHILRHQIIEKFKDKIDFIAGRGYKEIEYKLEALKDYRYQIVVENGSFDYYFTEKIIDCFVTGVIPIYWGCPSIGKFFNLDGFYHFRTLDELDVILKNISEKDYNEKLEYVKENFEEAKKYTVPENWLWDNLLKKL